ncbi:bacillithiol biosynthesis deacetylase BshB1 [Bacillota bacterium Lsc_1132]
METKSFDILAFGAHADDVEIGMGGTIAKYAFLGKKIAICDLTDAALSSNGTVETRKIEAREAAQILGVSERISLGMPDRGLLLNQDYIQKIAGIIRTFRPQIVFAPYFTDRHPDHGNCARLVVEAVFSAGIRKFQTDHGESSHRVKSLYFYMINGFHQPDFAIDISAFMNTKKEALNAYKSQFVKSALTFDTPLVNGYIETVEARERMFGKQVGVEFAEGFKTEKPVLLNRDLLGES